MTNLEERDPCREAARIEKVFYGKEDHGILTCWVTLDLGGGTQAFGGLALGARLGPDFTKSLCRFFGVSVLADLRLKKCWALRCFPGLNSPIEGLENERGERFTITGWRRKHEPGLLSVLVQEAGRIESEISFLERRIQAERNRLRTLRDEYRDWELS